MISYKQLSYQYFFDRQAFVPLGELTNIASGIFMRTGDVFVLDNFNQTTEATIGYSRRIQQDVEIDHDIVMPLIQRNTDIAFLDTKDIMVQKGLIYIDAENYSRTSMSPEKHFLTGHPKFADYILKCEATLIDKQNAVHPIAYTVLTAKQIDILSRPKHILSVKDNICQSCYDNAGIYAFPTGMYGISSLHSKIFNDKTITAILNSKLFAFLRYKEEQTNIENRQARYDSVAKFPIPTSTTDYQLLKALEILTVCLTYLCSKSFDTSEKQVKKCLLQIMDMIVFELYFGSDLQEKGLSITGAVKDLIQIESSNEVSKKTSEIYKWFQTSTNIIRQKIMLLDSRSPELLYPIFMQFIK